MNAIKIVAIWVLGGLVGFVWGEKFALHYHPIHYTFKEKPYPIPDPHMEINLWNGSIELVDAKGTVYQTISPLTPGKGCTIGPKLIENCRFDWKDGQK